MFNFILHNFFFLEDTTDIGTEPMKFDGFCLRSFEDDIKWEEIEKNKQTNTKKNPLKKK